MTQNEIAGCPKRRDASELCEYCPFGKNCDGYETEGEEKKKEYSRNKEEYEVRMALQGTPISNIFPDRGTEEQEDDKEFVGELGYPDKVRA